jgi:hypothetical protein
MKNFTFGLFMLLGSSAFAQSVPNGDFETWSDPNTPANWAVSSTTLAPLGVAPNVSQETTNPGEGSSSVKLTTASFNAGPVSIAASGAISSGTITYANNTLEFGGGFPFTTRPGQLTGVYKYTPTGVDSSYVWVLLSRWNTTTNQRDTVATGAWWNNQTVNAWTPFGVTLNYLSALDPDTALIVALSTKRIAVIGGSAGSALWLDDMAFEFGAGVNDLNNVKTINAYPNPATDVLNIEMNAGDYTKALVYDMTGRLVNTLAIEGTSVNVSALNEGQYVMEMRNNNGRVRLIFAKQ